ncbi:inosose dehydratase [Gammaproteobacteria bacterium]|nr:inosose dehydratase [Gammaproteobacteria bacterium]
MDKNKIKLAIAPIGWTNDDLPDLGKENTFEQCISEMALAGFVGSEVGSKYPRDVNILKPMLKMRGLQICNAWFSTFFVDGLNNQSIHDKNIQDFIEHMNFLKDLGAKVIGCSEQSLSIQGTAKSIFEEKPTFNDEQWLALINGYNQIADIASQNGMQVCLHHHMGTGIQTSQEIDRFMQGVQADVYLLYDTGHAYYSEGTQAQMLDILRKYIKRINHIHLKDVRDHIVNEVKINHLSFLDGVKKGTFTVPGDGVIDFAPVFKIIDEAGYQGWMVVEAEQDPALANPFEYAQKARAYIQKMTNI